VYLTVHIRYVDSDDEGPAAKAAGGSTTSDLSVFNFGAGGNSGKSSSSSGFSAIERDIRDSMDDMGLS